MRLNPAHEESNQNENERDNGKHNTDSQHCYCAIRIFAILDHAEQARPEAEQNQRKQYDDDDFNNEHDVGSGCRPRQCTRTVELVEMMLGKRCFRPPWWGYVLTLVGMAAFTALGFWQLERAAYKDDIESRFANRLAEDYQPLSAFTEGDDLEYRKLLLQGRFDNQRNLLVDNQLHRGRAGYYILTPLQLAGSERIVLINRGWAPWGESRDEVSPIAKPQSTEAVAGIAYFPSEPALDLGGAIPAGNWPRLLSHIDIESLQPSFDGRLEPWVLWLATDRPGAYVRDWNPVWMRPEKSRAYATQWFAFAVLALVFFIILNLRKNE